MTLRTTKVSEVLPLIDAEIQVTVEHVLKEMGTEDPTVHEFVNACTSKGVADYSLAAIKVMAAADRNKFAAKLTLEQRYEILALRHAGVSIRTLSEMYGINNRTVIHICNPIGRYYGKIREEMKSMGVEAFQKKYLTQAVMDKALIHRNDKKDEIRNNRHAKGKEGVHVVKGKNCTSEHRVAIAWREATDNGDEIKVAGWYYRDLDGSYPESWCWVDEKSLSSSQACYLAMLGDIQDKW